MWKPHFVTMIFLAAATAVGSSASATSIALDLNGSGINASINLTYVPNPNVGILPGTAPNPVDPIGSYIVTGIGGTFSDTNIGIFNAPISGIVPSSPSSPHSTNLLAPHSFGFYPIASGVSSPDGLAPGLSYDNLLYPNGSPQTATDYPFHGGLFDIYGIVFTIGGGDAVNLWSNGDFGSGATYGVGVTDGLSLLDYASPVAVSAAPEPGTWLLMIVGFGAAGCALRRGKALRSFRPHTSLEYIR
jgi:hypothetical protein